MSTPQTDRRYAAVASKAIKAPCVIYATANVPTLNGLFTLNGYALQDQDRVLLPAQTDETQNGIWLAQDSGDWVRAPDFDGDNDVTQGTMVPVMTTAGVLSFYALTTLDPIIDTSDLTFEQVLTLTTTSLTGADITNSTFSGTNTNSGTINGGTYAGATFNNGTLSGTIGSSAATIYNANLSAPNLSSANSSGGTFTNPTLEGTISTTGATLEGGTFEPYSLAASSGVSGTSASFSNGLQSGGKIGRSGTSGYTSASSAGQSIQVNDLIQKWGRVVGAAMSSAAGNSPAGPSIDFPTAFPNAIIGVWFTVENTAAVVNLDSTPTTTGFNTTISSLVNGSTACNFRWTAFGN